jgi:hypothetical protein
VRARLDHPIVDSDAHAIDFEPELLDYLRDLAGPGMVERYRRASGDGLAPRRPSDAERRDPRLLVSRLEELGVDFSVVHSPLGFAAIGFEDEELRRATCRALNACHADLYRDCARWLTPAAIIPMRSPQEAIAELHHAVGELDMKVVMLAGLGGAHDYDPVWARCVDLGVCPTFHGGRLAAAGEATCRALLLGGVTRRFPQLRFAFLGGGVAWAFDARTNPFGAKLRACFGSGIGHWDGREPVAEAWELVQRGLVSKEEFRAFTFENPVRFWTTLAPGFFDGTSLESAARALVGVAG